MRSCAPPTRCPVTAPVLLRWWLPKAHHTPVLLEHLPSLSQHHGLACHSELVWRQRGLDERMADTYTEFTSGRLCTKYLLHTAYVILTQPCQGGATRHTQV